MPAEPGPAVESTYTIYRAASRPRFTPAPARLLMIALVTVAGWTLIHRVGEPAAASQQAPLRHRYATSVLVLNGNGRSGVAGTLADRLLARGYRETYAADAQVKSYARSVILFRRGWGGEAERLAKDAKIRAVAPLDGRLPAGSSRYPLVAVLGK